MPPLGVPGRQPGGCDDSSDGVVRLRAEYFEARAFLFVCSGDKACPRAEGGQGDDGACCLAAGASIALSPVILRRIV